MGNTVRLTQSVDDREVVAAFERQLKLLEKLEKGMQGVGDKGQKSGERTTTAWLGMNRTIELVGQSAARVLQTLEKTFDLQHKIRTDAASGAEALDSALRGFLIQQGARGLSADQARQETTRIATQAGVDPKSVLRIATSEGVNAER